MDYLIKNNSIHSEDGKNNTKNLYPDKKGISCAKTLRGYVPKSYRDKIVQAALRYFAKLKYESEVKIEYIELDKGYYVHCRCLDIGDDLLDLKLFAPDRTQAEMIGNKIMLNPTGFYSKILSFALENKEEEFNPDDL